MSLGRVSVAMYEIDAAGAGLWRPGQQEVTQPYVSAYFESLPAVVAHAPYHDLNPVLLRSPAPGLSVIPVTTEAFYPQGLLLEPSGSSLTRLAFRPTATFHTPR